jgi:hypothetical protein
MTWSAIETMPEGYTGLGRLGDDREVDIYRVSDRQTLDAASGLPVDVVSWKRHSFHTVRELRKDFI